MPWSKRPRTGKPKIVRKRLADGTVRVYEYDRGSKPAAAPRAPDSLAMLMAGAESIRDVIAFPKTQTAACPLTEAPTEVSEQQLRELHIRVRQPPPV